MAKSFGKITAVPKSMLMDEAGGIDITFHIDRKHAGLMRREWQDIREALNQDRPNIRLCFEEWRNSRSLEQNNLMWTLLDLMATAMQKSGMALDSWDCYLACLSKYGARPQYIECLKEAVPALRKMWREIVEVEDRKGGKTVLLKCFPGSSTYDTLEMSHLIDGIFAELDAHGIANADAEYWREEYGYDKTHPSA